MSWLSCSELDRYMNVELAEHILTMPEHQLWSTDWWYMAMAFLLHERTSA